MSDNGFDRDEEASDERFADWVDGRMAPDELAAFAAELDQNAALRQQAEDYRDTVALVRQHLRHEVPPVDLMANVMAELPGAPARGRLIPLLASLTAAAAMVVLYFVLRDMTQGPAVVDSEPTAAGSDVERREFAPAGDPAEVQRNSPEMKNFTKGKSPRESAEPVVGVVSEEILKAAASNSGAAEGGRVPKRRPKQFRIEPPAGKKSAKPRIDRMEEREKALADKFKSAEAEGKLKDLRQQAKSNRISSSNPLPTGPSSPGAASSKVKSKPGRDSLKSAAPHPVQSPKRVSGGGASPRVGLSDSVPADSPPTKAKPVGDEVRRLAALYLHKVAEVGEHGFRSRERARLDSKSRSGERDPKAKANPKAESRTKAKVNDRAKDVPAKSAAPVRKGEGSPPTRARRASRGGRGGNRSRGGGFVGREFAAPGELTVLVLEVPIAAADSAGNDPRDRLEKKKMKKVNKATKGTAAEKTEHKDDEVRPDPAKRGTQVPRHGLLAFLDSRREKGVELAKASEVDAPRVSLRFGRAALGPASAKPGEYVHRFGDEIFSVRGDGKQLQQFFVELRDYLALKREVDLPTKAASGKAAVPRVQKLGSSDRLRLVFRGSQGGVRPEGMQFLVVLRPK